MVLKLYLQNHLEGFLKYRLLCSRHRASESGAQDGTWEHERLPGEPPVCRCYWSARTWWETLTKRLHCISGRECRGPNLQGFPWPSTYKERLSWSPPAQELHQQFQTQPKRGSPPGLQDSTSNISLSPVKSDQDLAFLSSWDIENPQYMATDRMKAGRANDQSHLGRNNQSGRSWRPVQGPSSQHYLLDKKCPSSPWAVAPSPPANSLFSAPRTTHEALVSNHNVSSHSLRVMALQLSATHWHRPYQCHKLLEDAECSRERGSQGAIRKHFFVSISGKWPKGISADRNAPANCSNFFFAFK